MAAQSRLFRSRSLFGATVACGAVLTIAIVHLASPVSAAPTPHDTLACPSCEDYDACTIDSCDSSTGTCRHDPQSCDDANPCTADSCSNQYPGIGCVHLRLANGTPCDDGRACTLADMCIELYCTAIPEPAGTSCQDGNPCTTNDECEHDGNCSRVIWASAGSACNDGDACTTSEICVVISSGVACLGDRKSCDDGDSCTVDTCDQNSGECLYEQLDCDDGNPCTEDSCDPASGTCTRTGVSGSCEDGSLCTLDDVCSGGNCLSGSTQRNCDDGRECTQDSCDPRLGCRHIYDESPDADADGVPDSCDNCPTISNADQNPCACAECFPLDITISFDSPFGRGSGLVGWRTGMEHDIKGFNVVVLDIFQGRRVVLNPVLIPCAGCITDTGHSYVYLVPKHRSGRSVYIEQVRLNGTVEAFGPAVRQ